MNVKYSRGVFLPFEIGSFTGSLYMPLGLDPSAPRVTAVYCLGSEERELREIVSLWKKPEFKPERPVALLAIHPLKWEDDYSPLKAPALRQGEPPFGDGAEKHLKAIRDQLIPAMEKTYNLIPDRSERILVGYSLAGLCALCGLIFVPDAFSRFGGVSPSLWLDGFRAFFEGSLPPDGVDRLYLSLGKKEPAAKNERMARVGVEFTEISGFLSSRVAEGRFLSEWNDGNHFFEPARRIAKAIAFLSA